MKLQKYLVLMDNGQSGDLGAIALLVVGSELKPKIEHAPRQSHQGVGLLATEKSQGAKHVSWKHVQVMCFDSKICLKLKHYTD